MKRIAALVLSVLLSLTAAAQDGPLQVRVVDVGAGLCCVVVTPDQHYMIYDAGNYEDSGNTAIAAIGELIPPGATIDLLVLSHGDADHLAAVPRICEDYTVKRVLRDGFERTTQTWQRMEDAVRAEVEDEGCEDLNLKNVEVPFGTQYAIGDFAQAAFVSGFYELPEDWPNLSDSEGYNARSVIVRLEFGGRSILFCGDGVGRHIGDASSVCIAAERFMVDNAAIVPIDSDIIVAPHHGADNGSSRAFIEAVSPEHVVFSAGSKFRHPRAATAERYAAIGVNVDNMFRTDFGDNEGGDEWASVPGASPDPKGDDDVEIELWPDGQVSVRYRAIFFAPAPTVPFALDGKVPAAPVTLAPPFVQQHPRRLFHCFLRRGCR